MSPALSAVAGGTIAVGYVPILRRQLRDGTIGIPLGTINPIRIRRDEHPLAFRVAACLVGGLVMLVLLGCLLLLVRSLAA